MSELDFRGTWGTCLHRARKLREKPRPTEAKTRGRFATGIFALAIACWGFGCDREKAPQPTEVVASALNASPKLGDFVLEAQNSIRLQTGGTVVNGGDIGRGVFAAASARHRPHSDFDRTVGPLHRASAGLTARQCDGPGSSADITSRPRARSRCDASRHARCHAPPASSAG
jgi:hypothetical protein